MYVNTSAKHDFKILIFFNSALEATKMALNAKITTQKEAEENTARLAKVKIGRIYLYVGRSCSVNLLQKCNELSM